ncbi:MAG: hypothetical protein IKX67_08025 [Bacteroidales bacterium]|nr:hypothetical protein [Bacteroidales bacterium]
MKRIVLAIMLAAIAAVSVRAQSVTKLSYATRLAYDYLSEKGYELVLDEDNDVWFIAGERQMYIRNSPSDPTMLWMCLPAVYSVDMSDRAQKDAALWACNMYNRKMKLIKPGNGDDGTVFFYADTYLGLAKTLADMSEYVDAVIDFMLQAVTRWLDMFKEYYNG